MLNWFSVKSGCARGSGVGRADKKGRMYCCDSNMGKSTPESFRELASSLVVHGPACDEDTIRFEMLRSPGGDLDGDDFGPLVILFNVDNPESTVESDAIRSKEPIHCVGSGIDQSVGAPVMHIPHRTHSRTGRPSGPCRW